MLDGPFGASQYVAGDDVVVLGWWGPEPGGAGRPDRVRLAGLDADARYRDIGSGELHLGAALTAHGLALPPEPAGTFGSGLTRLVRLTAG